MTERIDLSRADDPRDVVHRAVACLAQGGIVGLPTETTYGIVGGVIHPSAIARLASRHGSHDSSSAASSGRPTLLLKGPAEVDDWVDAPTELGRKWIRRAWPGPVTLVLPIAKQGLVTRLSGEVARFLVPDDRIALRVASSKMVREILRLVPCPLIKLEPSNQDSQGATTADDLASVPDLDMIIDVGTTLLGGPSSIVAVEGDRWAILRQGVVPERRLVEMAGTIVLFVCTGNTCRSPMAEALCKALVSRRIGCEPGQLIDRGVVILSAGVSAMDGMPAALHAIEVARSRGGSLVEHASRRAAPDLVRHADHIIAMTADHLDVLLDRNPEVAHRARLLDSAGDDIDDPVGSDLATYHQTAREIETHLERLLDELGF